MQTLPKRIVLIPAYQPETRLPALAAGLHRNGCDVVIVDDGSGERFAEIFARAAGDALILHHTENRGKGAALKTGIAAIRGRYSAPYLIVTADADGQHTLGDILRVSRQAALFPESLVLGCRGFDRDVPLRSRLGNTLTRLVFRLSTGVRIEDTQTGLRGFGDALTDRMLEVPGERYEYEMNVLFACAGDGIALRELRIETVYLSGNASSHFRPLLDSCRIYREILKFSLSSFVSFLADYALFCLLSFLTGMPLVSNVLARLLSAGLNFTLNHRLVFESRSRMTAAALRYAALVCAILVCNTLMLKGLLALGCAAFLAKLLTEVLLFTASYLAQHHFVFRKERKKA
ncbi:MAG: bifunctional glycosyltransferase family 2/GtrA family protein [Oscillospiraceae bacterium]|nr:bifunctional glycosyltransferase family 2/GtrA family protein [Oscillospiraceae bacterium]